MDDQKKDQQIHTNDDENLEFIFHDLPKEQGWIGKDIYCYQGFWFYAYFLESLLNLQKNFKPSQPPTNQVLLATFPKSGTTWFKALLFSILNRNVHSNFSKNHPLLTQNPHEFIPMLERHAHAFPTSPNPGSPLMNTHIPFTLLPKPVIDSCSRIVYVLRDPKDVFVSFWHHEVTMRPQELPLLSIEEAFEKFCSEISSFGPYWDHVLGYLKASSDFPELLMVVRYEEMITNPVETLKKLAEFLDQPFSGEEESRGMVEKLVSFCSFENMSNLDVNKTGILNMESGFVMRNDVFFRKGKIGDSKNFLTKEMMDRMDRITNSKLKGFGF